MNIYEGMFVLDDKRANENWDGVTKEIRGLLEKHGARVYNLERWDERRLAYRIKGRSRGVYVLTGFLAPGTAITAIERDCQLSDTILRVLILRDDKAEKLRSQGIFDPEAPEAAPEEKASDESQDSPQPQQPGGQPEAPAGEDAGPGTDAQAPGAEPAATAQ